MFTGHRLRTEDIRHLVNHPANVINIEYYAHVSMDRILDWGIEARSVNNEVRVTRLCGADTYIPLISGNTITAPLSQPVYHVPLPSKMGTKSNLEWEVVGVRLPCRTLGLATSILL